MPAPGRRDEARTRTRPRARSCTHARLRASLARLGDPWLEEEGSHDHGAGACTTISTCAGNATTSGSAGVLHEVVAS